MLLHGFNDKQSWHALCQWLRSPTLGGDMKNLFITSMIICLFACSGNAEFYEPETKIQEPGKVYAPQGYDSNDNVEIVFEGQYPSACYKAGLTSHVVDQEEKKIYITDTTHYFSEAFCAAIIVPYQKDVQAGILSAGKYQVFFRHPAGSYVEEAHFKVTPAKSENPDEYLYAPVQQSRFFPKTDKKPAILQIVGSFTNSCMKLKEIKVIPYEGHNVIDILPIAHFEMSENSECKEVPTGISFEKDIEMEGLKPGRVMFHIRALNGQSVNQLAIIK